MRMLSRAAGLTRLTGLAACASLLLAACSAGSAGGRRAVDVLYAGSLVNLMEHAAGPAFDRATGYRFEGFAGGSVELANEIKARQQRADVFVSAAPAVNGTLMGSANGGWVGWYAAFASAPLVIGYNPSSRFAAALRTRPWYQVMTEPGFRLGRTDPKLDPKGLLTVQLVERAAAYYRRPALVREIIGSPENPAQVFPEQDLLGRLESGQLDAAFFYSIEAVEGHVPFIALPAPLRLSATYTVTLVRGGADPAGAAAFVRYLLGPDGSALMRREGLDPIPVTVSGDRSAVPASLRSLLG